MTYLIAAFCYVAPDMSGLSVERLILEGIAFRFGVFTVTPIISCIFLLILGCVFLFLCVDKFKKINLLDVQIFLNFLKKLIDKWFQLVYYICCTQKKRFCRDFRVV